MGLEIYRGEDVVAELEIGKDLRFGWGLMNQHKIVVSGIKQYDQLQVQIGDYVVFKGVNFKINTVPNVELDDQLTYAITFEGPKYTWHDKIFLDEGEAEFSYYGNLLLYMQLFLTNINEIDPTWTLGTIADTEEKHLDFLNVTCHEAIIIIAEAFTMELDVDNKEISVVTKVGRDTGLFMEYGMGKGLYNLSRTYVEEKNIVTKVYGFGGTRNLPAGYRGSKRRLTFASAFKTNNIELYGTKEGQYTNDDIIPERIASVMAVGPVTTESKYFTITDSTLDFDINLQQIEGLKPKVAFTTGELAGEEFEVYNYDHATKVITLTGFINDNNVVLPNASFKAVVGDKYGLVDLELPASYVTAAELRVEQETEQYVLENSVPRVEYGGTLDPIHIRDFNIDIKPGDRVTFKDARIGLNDSIRITEISYPLDFALEGIVRTDTNIEVTIANFVTYTQQQRLRDEKLLQRHEIAAIDRRSEELARRGVQNLRFLEQSIFDADGNFDSDKLNVGVISALLGIFGTKSQNFRLNKVFITDNYNANPNSVYISGGELIHREISNPGNLNTWVMQAATQTGMDPAQLYYVYAKCGKLSQTGTWVITTDQIKPDDVPNFYHFLAGVVYPVIDGWRNSDFTNGIADINGNRLKIGKIVSRDGLTGFDLDNSTIFGRIQFLSNGILKDVSVIETIANSAQTAATNAANAASAAQTAANTANSALADIANDNLLTVAEKQDVLLQWNIIQGEKSVVNAQATVYAISTGSYDTAYNALNTYITPLLSSMTTNSNIVGTTFRSNFKAYYDAKVALLKLVSDKAKQLADSAQTTATNAATAAATAQTDANTANQKLADIANDDLLTPAEKQDVLKDWNIIQSEKTVVNAQASVYALTTTAYDSAYTALNTYITPLLANMTANSVIVGATFRTNFKNYYDAKIALLKLISDKAKQLADGAQTTANTAITNASTAQTAANNAQSAADIANAALADIANDNLLVPSEKQDILQTWLIIQSEKPVVNSQAAVYGITTASYDTAYNSLNSYITPLLASMTTNSTIVGATFRTTFKNYYDAKVALLKLVSDAAKGLVDNIKIGGRNFLRNSDFSTGLIGWANYGGINSGIIGGKLRMTWAATNTAYGINFNSVSGNPLLIDGQQYTMSAVVTTTKALTIYAYIGGNQVSKVINGTDTITFTGVISSANKLFLIYAVGMLSGDYFELDNVKIEFGNKATDWTPAPEDLTAALDAANAAIVTAQNAANAANTLLAEIANDDLLVPSEKQDMLKEWQQIQGEKPVINAQAGTYSITTAAYDTAYNSLSAYVTPLLANMSANSTIVATTFRATFKAYYDAKVALLKLISDGAKTLVDNLVVGGRNFLKDSALTSLSGWTTNGGTQAIETVDGRSVIRINTTASFQGLYRGNAFTQALLPNTDYMISYDIKGISFAANPSSIIVSINDVSGAISVPFSTSWQRVSRKVTTGSAVSGTVILYSNQGSVATSFYIKNIKIEKGNIATDYTPAPEDLEAAVLAANNAAIAAQGAADSANSLLADIANDNLLMPSEKQDVLKEWQTIQGEQPIIVNQAATYSVSSATYTSAYNTLNTYITPLLANIATNSTIVATTFRSNFKAYYDAKIALLKAVTDAAKVLADNAQTAATNANTAATNAATAASNAQTSANTANSLLADIANDNLLTPSEKQDVSLSWQQIQGEKPIINLQAGTYAVSTTAYDNAYNALNTYVSPLVSSLTTNSTIVGTTFRANFKAYYDARQTILKAISDAAKAYADALDVGGVNLVSSLPMNWEPGYYDASGGGTSTTIIRTKDFYTLSPSGKYVISSAANHRVVLTQYTSANVYIGAVISEPASTFLAFTSAVNAAKFRLHVAKGDTSAINADYIVTAKPKVEKGTTASDWTPSSADLTYQLNTNAARAEEVKRYTDGKAYVSGKMMFRDAEFAAGLNGVAVYNNSANGNVIIDRLASTSLAGVPTSSGAFLRIRTNGGASPGLGGFMWGHSTRANAIFIARIIARIPVGFTLSWATNAHGTGSVDYWATPVIGTGNWEEYIMVIKCGSTGTFSTTSFFYLTNTGGGLTTEWYVASASVYDVTNSEVDYIKDAQAKADAALASANTFADSVATSKANVAQAAAISAASTDAQTKASNAYNTAVSASNAYAQTAANNASTAAQTAAAADASNKATTAYNNAVAAATTQYNSLTASLKSLAYQDVVELAKLGTTIIEGGKIKTTLLDADYIRANVINAGYINALNLNVTQGIIGGWNIGATTLYSGTNPGNYIELKAGTTPQLYMKNAAQSAAEYSLLNSSGIAIISGGNALPTAYGSYNAVAAFKLKTGSSITDVALYCYAPAGVNALIVDGTGAVTGDLGISGRLFVQGGTVLNGLNMNVGGAAGDRPLRISANGDVYRGS